jgi:ABC-type transport system involved in multi-copper enzyme maturation permease subunit
VRASAAREFASAVATIMVKELRSRMRGRRAFVVLTAYLALLAFIAYGMYAVVAPQARDLAGGQMGIGVGQANASALIGQSIFSVLSILQIVLVCVMAPAFTSGQISLEREKQTLDLLISTPLRPGAIVIGKLLTALAYVVLMIVAAVPITAIVLMYGGATVGDIVRQQLVLLTTAVGLGAIGIFASALMQRTQAATVLAYCGVIGLTLGSALLFSFWTVLGERDRASAPEQIRYLNPMVAMLDVVSGTEPTGPTRITSPLYELFGADLGSGWLTLNPDVPFDGGVDLGIERGVEVPMGGASGYWWPRITATFLALAAILTAATMRLVLPAGMRWAWRARRRQAVAYGLAPGTIEEVPVEGEQ